MKKATKQAVPMQMSKKALMALCYLIAGYYTNQETVGEKSWHDLQWKIYGHVMKTYSNLIDDPRPNFTSFDNDKIREFKKLSEFKKAYPEIAKLAEASADLVKSKPKSSAPAEPEESSSLLERMDKLEEAIVKIASNLK